MTASNDLADGCRLALRVLILTEIRLLREGLARALSDEPEIAFVEAAGALQAAACLVASRPHMVLAESLIVRSTDLVAVAGQAGAAVVAFAVAGEDDAEVLACAEAGVAGIVERSATMRELISALKEVARGEAHCSPRIAGLMMRRVARQAARAGPADPGELTRREREVAKLLARGFANKDIAVQLGIETATVKNHVHSVLEKLRVRTRGEAAAWLRRTLRDASSWPAGEDADRRTRAD